MDFLQAIYLGFLQGVTEFLPVSSSGHLVIAQAFLPNFEQPGVLFDVLLHLGTMGAVVLYFRKDLLSLVRAPFIADAEALIHRKLLLLIVAGSVPTAVIGLAFKDFFESLFHDYRRAAMMLIVTGIILFISERFRRGERKEKDLTLGDALLTGVVQGCAIIPGISRSGSTIAALLLRGVDGETAARFSFLLALPAVGGAALLSLKDVHGVAEGLLPVYLAGAAISFATGLFSIHFLLAIIRKRRLFIFALYCWIVGGFFTVFVI